MRKPSKGVLRNALTNNIILVEQINKTVTTRAIDGGTFLHKVKWLAKVKYGETKAVCFLS